MAHWHDVNVNLAPGEHTVLTLGDFSILLVNADGHFYAVENICPHDGGELDGGAIEDTTVTCPRHGACFSLKNGAVLKPPAFEDIGSFAVRSHDGRLQIYDEPKKP